ncbi:granulysin isoform X2 [Moschus berezovskii]|uniref:granulysin isoform X2 n=1 Tax=Moschus berezovskii TaxID=68408 RepID=UPI0024437C23|nr:granulysin isoform X2 [Moschus berezovskii]
MESQSGAEKAKALVATFLSVPVWSGFLFIVPPGKLPSHRAGKRGEKTGTGVCGKPSDTGGGQQEEEDPVWSDCQILYKTGCGGSLGSCLNMTSWAVLLVTSVLLVAPGLAFSGLTPEHHDQAMAHLCDGDELCQGLAPKHPQGDLLLQGEELGLLCDSCRKVIKHLEDMVGDQPNENTITEAASKVCSKMKLLRGLCKSIMKKFLRRISGDIIAGKQPQAICVDIRMCKSKAGLI